MHHREHLNQLYYSLVWELLCRRSEGDAEGGEHHPAYHRNLTSCHWKHGNRKDSYHPAHRLFALLLSGRRYRSIRTKTTRFRYSFFPQLSVDVFVLTQGYQGFSFINVKVWRCGLGTGQSDTLSLSCLASVIFRLFFLIADSVAVIRSTIGTLFGVTAKFNPLTKTSQSESPVRYILYPSVLFPLCELVCVLPPIKTICCVWVICFILEVDKFLCSSFFALCVLFVG